MAHTQNGPLILVVDPDEQARNQAANAFARAGYCTLRVGTGEEALEIAQRDRPAIVVLEVCLPGVCGYEVCRELRDTLGQSLSIVFVSGIRNESFDKVGGLLLGADDYLVKPFDIDELLARVRALLRRETPSPVGAASTITPREQEVLELLALGLSKKEIASRLFISPRTVSTHVEHIFTKLGVQNRAQAIALSYQNGLVHGGTGLTT
jgi:DNA-binding NarL/FixJ family response regulator